MLDFFGDVIGAGLSYMGQREATKSAEQQAELNRQMQLQFAQQGVRWRVADAQAAGIHPLYAMGASIPTYSPSSVAFGNELAGVGEGISRMGQSLDRAIQSTRGVEERDDYVARLGVRRAELENDVLRAQIDSINARTQRESVGPAFPLPLQGAGMSERLAGLVDVGPVQRQAAEPGLPGREAGFVPDVGFSVDTLGRFHNVPSKDVKDRIDDDIIAQALNSYRNHLLPMWDREVRHSLMPRDFPGRGMRWAWFGPLGGWRPIPIGPHHSYEPGSGAPDRSRFSHMPRFERR